ncbi:carbamoyltransferase [Aurantimonas sp. E1-2-R+4]|uniref:carbamoyltransferase family protein n=1 Tax=Aurantimonas sp. E1-2-R+4 TaxID=3113714 RepID=UPI002F9400EE
MTVIVGLSAYFHDSAAAIVVDGRLVAAAQEERFSRKKHDSRFPRQALDYVLEEAGVSIDDVDHFAFHDKPFLKFERLIETYLTYAPKGFGSFRRAIPIWLREKLFMKSMIGDELQDAGADKACRKKILFAEHHQGHAASAFFPSPFDEALVLTMDGVGEWATTSVSIGRGNKLEMVRELHFPHSLGLLYSAFTYYLGFKVNSGEYKVMGLAPYGEPRFADLILEKLVDVKPDGSFRLDQSYFTYATGLTMTGPAFAALFGQPTRNPETDRLTQFHMDVAASLQAVTEEIILRMTRSLAEEFNIRNLCLAGGVALNCVANGKILRDGRFDDIWIQPAAGDAGGSVGAAMAAWHCELGHPRQPETPDAMRGAYVGPEFSQEAIEAALDACGAVYSVTDSDALVVSVATELASGKAVGWFQGRMEFGPRALGGRSILADPRSGQMQKTLNLKVKFRESFRPFAPAVLREHVGEWFEIEGDSPYMLMVADVRKSRRRAMSESENSLFGIDKLNVARSEIPAVTHVDYSARIQTVSADTNPRFHALLSAFNAQTGCPVLVNTSFNVRGEPIVNTPQDAFRCFMGTGLDVLAIGNCLLFKEEQTAAENASYRDAYELD